MYLNGVENEAMSREYFFSLTAMFRTLFQILIIVSMFLAKTEVRAWMG